MESSEGKLDFLILQLLGESWNLICSHHSVIPENHVVLATNAHVVDHIVQETIILDVIHKVSESILAHPICELQTAWTPTGIVNQEASLADEVVVVLIDGPRLHKSHQVADVAENVIVVDLTVIRVIPSLKTSLETTRRGSHPMGSMGVSTSISDFEPIKHFSRLKDLISSNVAGIQSFISPVDRPNHFAR